MILSMTGYGKGSSGACGRKFNVELKAVNSKYCEFNIRLPRVFNPLEERLRKQLSERIYRGRVDVNINYESNSSNDTKITYNENLAEAYHKILSAMSWKFDLKPDDGKFLELISGFHNVIEIVNEIEDNTLEEIWSELSFAVSQAIVQFLEMRRREGDILCSNIHEKGRNISKILEVIEDNAPIVVENYREKLNKRMKEALSSVAIDEARFLNEVAHFADKASIDEEITRMKSHLVQLELILSEGGAVGRKLDFLAQEMAREANTIGSKANSAALSKIVIELKSEVEKIREQVQNIE